MTDATVCSIPGCERPRRARGWCGTHYQQWRKRGDPESRHQRAECSIDGCSKLVEARGWCTTHYQRWIRKGDPVYPVRTRGRVCDEVGCDLPHSSKGKCQRHASLTWAREIVALYGDLLSEIIGRPT